MQKRQVKRLLVRMDKDRSAKRAQYWQMYLNKAISHYDWADLQVPMTFRQYGLAMSNKFAPVARMI